MHPRIRSFVVIAAALVSPSVGSAQHTSARPIPASGPRLEVTATAVRQVSHSSDGVVTMQQRRSQGKPVALMIVGGAALVIGLIVGGDVGTLFAIGGAVAFLYGLYQYLK